MEYSLGGDFKKLKLDLELLHCYRIASRKLGS